MARTTQSPPLRVARSVSPGVGVTGTRPVYYISDRPEAYEVFGEVSHDMAKAIAETIAAHAASVFPGIEFKVDSGWHSHRPGMERVAAYIERHWQRWVDQMAA